MRLSLGFAFLLMLTDAVRAAGISDPDWPCIQRKVPNLSIGQMWSGPPIDDAILADWRASPEVARLAPVLALRRTSIEEAGTRIADFAQSAGKPDAKDARLSALFAGIFTLIERERKAIIAGIARYANKQTDLAERIETRRDELEALGAAVEPDYDRIEETQDWIDWDTRIYQDRAQSLVYVCETPVILEKRAFALARMILAHLD